MTEYLETVVKRAQKCLEAVPVIVLGSGASAAYGIPGMGPLRDHLLEQIQPPEDDAIASKIWEEFKSHLQANDLESSLQKVQLSEQLLKAVIRETWSLINQADLKIFERTVRGDVSLALTDLYRYLFSSTRRVVSVITPNYDRIAEYAADAGDFAHHAGFSYGYIRFRDSSWRLTRGGSAARTVEIWKVHGSLDWFKRDDDTLVALPPGVLPPEGLIPAIVTPGVTKYQIAYQEPFRSAINGADVALQKATAYVCIGYGFNDEHIQPKLMERVVRASIPIVVLAKTLTASAKGFLLSGRCKEFLAVEDDGDGGTLAYSPEHLSGVRIPELNLWSLQEFLTHTVLGTGRSQNYATL